MSAAAAAAEKKRWTLEEYLAMEPEASEKHEFVDGEVFAMAGASYGHNRIVSKLLAGLERSVGRQCAVLASDMKIHIAATGDCFYPDASLVCGEPQFHEGRTDVILNPDALFDVLSPGTERFDRGDKFEKYRALSSLRDYVLVSQDRVRVEHFCLGTDARWVIGAPRGRGQVLVLPCGEIAVDDLYQGVL